MKQSVRILALALALVLLFCGCAQKSTGASNTGTVQTAAADSNAGSTAGTAAAEAAASAASNASSASSASTSVDTSELFSKRDLSGAYEENEAIDIALNGDSAACSDSGVTVEGSTVTITAAGVYVLTGTLNDGSIIVNVGKEDKVQLVLSGVTISSSDFAPIYVAQADKVFVTLASGTVNRLSNGGSFTRSTTTTWTP